MAGRRRGPLPGILLIIGVMAVAVAGVVGWLRSQDLPVLLPMCTAELDGTTWYLDPEQADNAALLTGTALRRGLPARAATIAIATALQESGLRNLEHGDRDSLGLFQQRPSQGWGDAAQVTDPVYATGAFYDALEQVEGYQDLEITVAAQAVQRSAFPDAYAQHEARARSWSSALSGYSPSAVSCTLGEAEPGDLDTVLDRVAQDLDVPATGTGVSVTMDATALPGGQDDPDRLAWAVAQWAVATAGPLDVTRVEVAGQAWDREAAAWAESESPTPSGFVLVVLAGA